MSHQGETGQADGKGKSNRLIDETSPYLLQHAYNPVEWYPWGAEALDKAKQNDKPILLSIGYSACHWCHVMEHESFEDPEIAKIMNEKFVPIKVDREERPDLDDIYMKSVQMMTGHGGWPMTVFLTPELKPFYGGTYFPPADRHGLPSFRRVLLSVALSWLEQRENIEKGSDELSHYLGLLNKITADEQAGGNQALAEETVSACLTNLLRVADPSWGGFGGAPKFPQAQSLNLIMRRAGSLGNDDLTKQCQSMLENTLNKMAYGGIHDQIGGGFARYSVDRQWLVPHFEKMLYDNAMLARVYLDGYLLNGNTYWKDVAKDCLDFVLRELTSEEGAFYSSLDADSEGEEGKFYVWRPTQITDILGHVDGQWFNKVYGVTDLGNFEHMTSVLHLSDSPENLANQFDCSEADLGKRLIPLRQKLLSERNKRIAPGRDEKVLTSWNSLMISALTKGYVVLQDPQYLQAARKASEFILQNLVKDGRLLRTWGKGQAKLAAYLDDYAYFVQALIDLAEVDFESKWLEEAIELTDKTIEHFWDQTDGGFFYTADDHETLLMRPKNYNDGPTPSAISVVTNNLLKLANILDNKTYRAKAEAILKLYAPHFVKAPDQFANLICALDFYLAENLEIALLTDSAKDDFRPMLFATHSVYLPNGVFALKDFSNTAKNGKWLEACPLLRSRSLLSDKTTAYVCHKYTCSEPVENGTKLVKQLRRSSSNV
jgi:uncharacterized protein YyaL (SSP411 family)